ncbi:hypothetical protein [Amycolatopsis sp. GM8]|uniref:hypothetical protein n=1 Tax=Amycolatopsis sp. GM8 TaxID=2896530 RepID=UPI001F2DA0EF|nr:hypothetical protein [Amycolatopsis sp. GM8]
MTEIAPEDTAKTLHEAAQELRRRMNAQDEVEVNVEYVLFVVSRLLDSLGRSIGMGRPLERHAADAALEIAHHVLHHDPAGHRPPHEG